ncbi:hypothetical protein Hanom_Chr03g00262241 [Helianthus anomalus]
MHEERECGGVEGSKVVEESPRKDVGEKVVPDLVGPLFGNNNVGGFPHVGLDFASGVTGRVGLKKLSSGSKARRARAQTAKGSSPVDNRPKKRSRRDLEAFEPGFGFVGFTSASSSHLPSSSPGADNTSFDLNTCAPPEVNGGDGSEPGAGGRANGADSERN